MDLEFLFYLVLGVLGIILSLRKNKKKNAQQTPHAEEAAHGNEEENLEEFFRRMGGYAEETGDAQPKTGQSPDDTVTEQGISPDGQSAAASEIGSEDEADKRKEIDTVKESFTKKKASVLDLRKAVIYRTILDRKYF